MFRPNTICHILRKNAKRDIHGKESFQDPVMAPCAIVHLAHAVEPTSIRADSSASRGSADQETLAAKILFPPHIRLVKGDVIRAQGFLVEVVSIQPRLDIFGKVEHLEVGGDIKGDM